MANARFKSSWDHRVYGSEGREADPIQGNDVDVWVEDPAYRGPNGRGGGVGAKILMGSFNSIVITLRFSTEPYQTFRQRIHRLLDGDIQIAFVLERGWIDTAVHVQTFGFSKISRAARVGRSPRVEITLNVDTRGELPTQFQEWYLSGEHATRMTDGQLKLTRAKMDSLHQAISAGKQLGVNQWQGLAEGYEVVGIQGYDNVGQTGVADYITDQNVSTRPNSFQLDPANPNIRY